MFRSANTIGLRMPLADVGISFVTVTITTLISILTLITLALGMVKIIIDLRTTKAGQKENKDKLEDIHIIVNSRYDDLVKYVGTLSDVLKNSNITVPSPFDRKEIMSSAKEVERDNAVRNQGS
jgi:hypothetical protein